jgi:adenosylcobinamide-GDP ribazoletransferase
MPLKSDRIEDVAKNAWLFPVVALLIGILVYIVGFLSFRFLRDENIATLLTLLTIYFITGLMHLDGLADFSDGIMASGDSTRKRAAMKDESVGIAGIFSLFIVLLLNLFSIRYICSAETNFMMYGLFCALVISEVSAKLSMNTCLLFGREIDDGMGSIFMKKFSTSKYVAAFLVSIFISLIAASFRFLFVLIGVIVALFVLLVANKNFDGINGDVIGASNEIARVITLFAWAIA